MFYPDTDTECRVCHRNSEARVCPRCAVCLRHSFACKTDGFHCGFIAVFLSLSSEDVAGFMDGFFSVLLHAGCLGHEDSFDLSALGLSFPVV